LKEARLVLLSKNGKKNSSLNDIRPKAVLPQILKVLKKAIKRSSKLWAASSSSLVHINWFQKGQSSATNLTIVKMKS